MRLPLLVVLSGFLGSCVAPVQNRFPADVSTSIQRSSMRRLETQSLILYYPAKRVANARRVAERVEGCTERVRAQTLIRSSYAQQKMVLVMPDVPMNNAFVFPTLAGYEPISVTPTGNTFDFTSELGMPPDPSYIGCHEIVHYVHMLQVSGIWGWANRWFGAVVTPQIGLDPWFSEGLATYYESKLQPGTGRMAWPAWRGMFAAGFAGERIGGGDLNVFHRPFHWGNHYLVGSHFVEFIAERYGERSLWKLIKAQGGSFFFPFGVALRWKSATGKTLPALIDEFADFVQAQYPKRARPPEQKTVRGAGSVARYAVAPTGREALILASGDLPPRLRIYDGGRLVRERNLTEILPPRRLAIASPILTSGLSFTGDGRLLYFVAVDAGVTEQEARLLRYDIDADKLSVVLPRLNGPGGGVSADGSTYYYSYADGDRQFLAALDLATKKARVVRKVGPRGYYGPARPSPDGTKIAASLFDGSRFLVRVLSSSSGRTLAQIELDGALHDPSWVDNDRLIMLGEHDGRFQVHSYRLSNKRLERISDAPYLAFQARVHGDKVRFLNREGWAWTLDEVPLRALPSKSAGPASAALPELPFVGPGGATHAAAPGVAQRAAVVSPLRVVSDQPYSWIRESMSLSLHTPFFLSPSERVQLMGLSLAGGDPLSFVRVSGFALWDFMGSNLSFGAQSSTTFLAPWNLELSVQKLRWNTQVEVVNGAETSYEVGPLRQENVTELSISRGFRTSSVRLSALYVEDLDQENPSVVLRERSLGGGRLDLGYTATEATAFGGLRRGLRVSASAAHFPYSTLDDPITDVGGAFAVIAPMPWGARHRLSLGLRARRLYGVDRSDGFLEVGGASASFAKLWERSDGPDNPEFAAPAELSPQVEFHEPLRGFEDAPFTTDRIALGQLTYSYPIILDMGFASTAYILPSWFFRQLDLQLFASAATDSFAAAKTHRRVAAGGSVSLAMSVWLLPISVRYQLARRFTDDRALVHSIAIGAGI